MQSINTYEARKMRELAEQVLKSVAVFEPLIDYDCRHIDHAIHVLNADDEIAEPLPDET